MGHPVLYLYPWYLVVSVDETRDADGLLWESLGHDLVGALGLLADAVPGEDGVANAHQDVVHAVQLHELHAAPPHVRQDAVVAEGAVQTPVPIGRPKRKKLLHFKIRPGQSETPKDPP